MAIVHSRDLQVRFAPKSPGTILAVSVNRPPLEPITVVRDPMNETYLRTVPVSFAAPDRMERECQSLVTFSTCIQRKSFVSGGIPNNAVVDSSLATIITNHTWQALLPTPVDPQIRNLLIKLRQQSIIPTSVCLGIIGLCQLAQTFYLQSYSFG